MSVYDDLFLAKVQIQYFIFLSLSSMFVTISCAALEVFHCCFPSVSSFDYCLSFHYFLQRPLFITPRFFFVWDSLKFCLCLPSLYPGIPFLGVAFGNLVTFFQSLVELLFYSRFMFFCHKLKNCSWIHGEFSDSHFKMWLLIYVILNPSSAILFWFSCHSDSRSPNLILKLFFPNPSYLRL